MKIRVFFTITMLLLASALQADQPQLEAYEAWADGDTLNIVGKNFNNGNVLEVQIAGRPVVEVINPEPTYIAIPLPDDLTPGTYTVFISSGGGTIRYDDIDFTYNAAAVAPELCDLELRIALAVDGFSIAPSCLPDVPVIPTVTEASFDTASGVITLSGSGTPYSTVMIYSDVNCENVWSFQGTIIQGTIPSDGIIDINTQIPAAWVPIVEAILVANPPLYANASDSFGQTSECAFIDLSVVLVIY